MKYFIHLAYKGTNYRGWQKQKNAHSVQAVLENAFRKMLHQPINCVACGRTDARVHASQFFCHVVLPNELDFDPVFRLNKMLPDDIVIFEFLEVEKTAHAQKDAMARTYSYFVHLEPDPFLNELSALYPKGLDLKKIEACLKLIPLHNDFKAFCKKPLVYKHTNCEISDAQLFANESNTRIKVQITANRFLRGMMRLLVGNLLEVAYGNLEMADFEAFLKNEKKPPFYKEAYPQGLYLSKVIYPYFIVERIDNPLLKI